VDAVVLSYDAKHKSIAGNWGRSD